MKERTRKNSWRRSTDLFQEQQHQQQHLFTQKHLHIYDGVVVVAVSLVVFCFGANIT